MRRLQVILIWMMIIATINENPNYDVDDDDDDENVDDEAVGDEDRKSNRHNILPLESGHDSFEGNYDVVRQWIIPSGSFHNSLPMEDLGSAIVDYCTVDTLLEDAIFPTRPM